jgi:hypothetical protein
MNNCPTTTMTTTPSPQIVVDTEQQQAQFFSSAEDILLSNTITPNLDLHTFCTHWGATRPAQAVCQAHAMSVIVHAIVTSSDTIHQQALALRSARLYSMRWMRWSGFPPWKCVMGCCLNYPKYTIPTFEDDILNDAPSINFTTYERQRRCTLHEPCHIGGVHLCHYCPTV